MFTRKTENYGFPQWLGGEHADFINDMNPAYATIDRVLKQASDDSATSVEQIKVLQEKTDELNANVERVEQEQASQSVSLANMQHQITDNKNNIAANSADILVLQEDNHVIHGDIHTLATRQNVLLAYDKELVAKILTGTATDAAGNSFAISLNVRGNVANIYGYGNTPINIPVGGKAIINVSMPGMTALMHNPIASPGPTFNGFSQVTLQHFETDSFEAVINNVSDRVINESQVIYFGIIVYDELTAAENAIKALDDLEVIDVD